MPIGKKMALVQCAWSAASTAGVFLGHGPSSKVSTTSPSRRKSWLLKCSNPKPGPPVVSISTTLATPSASGLPGQEELFVAGGGVAASAFVGAAAVAGAPCAITVGAVGAAAAGRGAVAGTGTVAASGAAVGGGAAAAIGATGVVLE